MPKNIIITLSILLALGLSADKYLPFLKEMLSVFIFFYILYSRNLNLLYEKIKIAAPLFLVFFILMLVGVSTSYDMYGENIINIKFFAAILFFISLSAFFHIHPNLIKTSLISFGIGVGILSILFSFNLLGENSYDVRNDRLFLLGENPNSLSVRVSLGILFLVWGTIEGGIKSYNFYRLLLLLPLPFMFNLILATGSKGSFILCVLSVCIYILLLKNISKNVKKTILFFALILSVVVFSIFIDSPLYNRFSNINLTSGRSDIWKSAYEIFAKNIFGVGEVGYKVEIYKREDRIIDTHNLFIYLAVTGGFFSVIIFIYFLLALLINNIKKYKKEKNVIYLIIFFSMVFIMSKTGGVLSYLIMWYFLACINGNLRNNTLEKKDEI